MSDQRCQLCGSSRKDDRLVLDPYFWLKSATESELDQFSMKCTWCSVLKKLYVKCLSTEEGSEGRLLDWGNQFEPILQSVPGRSGRIIEFEIFSVSCEYYLSKKSSSMEICHDEWKLKLI